MIPPVGLATVLLRRIDQTAGFGPDGDCWRWTAGQKNGYGRYGNHYAHRLFYELHYGAPPGDAVVRHTCHVRLCVNPHHLVLGTPSDNVADSVAVGIHAHGARTGSARLTEDDVVECRRLYWEQRRSLTELSRQFGITPGAIHGVVTGHTWPSIPMPPSMGDTRRTPRYRTAVGEDASNAVLSDEAVLRMRHRYWIDGETHTCLAAEFGVAPITAYDAIRGENWAHLEMPTAKIMSRRPSSRPSGERHHGAKLTAEDVRRIRSGESRARRSEDVAREYGVCVSLVRQIRRGEIWRDTLNPTIS